jgi:hypothetical protein
MISYLGVLASFVLACTYHDMIVPLTEYSSFHRFTEVCETGRKYLVSLEGVNWSLAVRSGAVTLASYR